MTCDFQQCGILTSVHSDEPVQTPVKLRNSKFCSVSSLTLIEYSSDEQRHWSVCAYAQAGLSLYWSHIPHCWKSHAMAQMVLIPSKTSARHVGSNEPNHHARTSSVTKPWADQEWGVRNPAPAFPGKSQTLQVSIGISIRTPPPLEKNWNPSPPNNRTSSFIPWKTGGLCKSILSVN